MSEIRSVSDLVQVLTVCSSEDADMAADRICQDPEVFGLLATACGLGTAAVGYGGKLVIAGNVTAPMVTFSGVVLAAAGVATAKRFCGALVRQTGHQIQSTTKDLLR